MKITPIDEQAFNSEALPDIIDRIFNVCKEDKTFKSKPKLEAAEEVSKKLHSKIDKQKMLIKRADEMKVDINKRIETLDETIEKMRSELLGMLGDE